MPLTKDDFKKGQIVACVYAGNAARYSKGYTLGEVRTIGKYVTVTIGTRNVRFTLDKKNHRDYLIEWTTVGGEDYHLFPSEQAYFDYTEKKKLLIEIERVVSPYLSESQLTLDQVRKIYDITHEGK